LQLTIASRLSIMANISELTWSLSQELFKEIDLDDLYLRQIRGVNPDDSGSYPYHLLIYTGRVTVAIHLNRTRACSINHKEQGLESRLAQFHPFSSWNPFEGPSD
jgi:hypothetical protein